MLEGWRDSEFLRHVFDATRIARNPTGAARSTPSVPRKSMSPSARTVAARSGISSAVATAFSVLVGAEPERPRHCVEVRGRIRVSPRLVIQPRSAGPTYGEVFGETELMERALVTRVFSFRYASRVSMQSEELTIRREEADSQRQLERVLDELARQEVINTGVILSPDVRFYPVSLDRFICEILDQEFQE